MKVRRTGMRRLRPGVVALAASLAMIGTSLPAQAAQAQPAPTQPAPTQTADAAAPSVAHLLTNSLQDPLGIGGDAPRLSWQLQADRRGVTQSAYEVHVATSEAGLASPDVWDSGKVQSDRSVDVSYGGPALTSHSRYVWSVRVWDDAGAASAWSAPGSFETGLLEAAEWTSSWIAGPDLGHIPEEDSLDGTAWVWYPEGSGTDLPAVTRYFRTSVAVPDKQVRAAALLVTADDRFTAYVNGQRVASGETWSTTQKIDVTGMVRAGDRTVLAVSAENTSPGPAGLLARLRVVFADGTVRTYDTGAAPWVSATEGPSGWYQADFDDTSWQPVRVVAPFGQGPWGRNTGVPPPDFPAPLLRTDFTVVGEVARARLYYSAVGYGMLSINGKRVGDSVLDPGFTVFDKRVQYVTHDVTGLLSAGANTLGAVLGRGFYGITTGNAWNHDKASWHGDPRMRAQLRIDYVDGRSETVVSDESWRTHDSPTLADSLYLGETYDARKEIPGWDSPGTDLSEWQQVRAVDAPTQIVSAAENEPIKVVETHRAVEVTNPKPGVYVFRFPVTLAGWARLHVTGPKGTEVSLKYGEKLRGDGTVNHDNGLVVGDDTQVDRYILRGGSAETWEPRFSYKGFTYVEVDGYPGTPTLDALEAREVHTAVPSTGEFTSSNELVNRIHTMTRQSILNNLHGIPTDTPFFEKNGWLGDAQMTAETAIDNFGMQRVYRKWLDDIRDSQGVDGLVPVIAPDHGWGMSNSVEWGAAYPLIVWWVYWYYGDKSVLADHYEAVSRYADYLARQSSDGIHGSGLGDWLPPGYGGNPPEGPAVSATAYVAMVDRTVADMAKTLGRAADEKHYRDLADQTADALNARLLDRQAGAYHTTQPVGYRQTPQILPLAFGLVPDDQVDRVVEGLVADIHRKDDHLDTGILGTKYLFPVLSEHGQTELAYKIVTQTTYPSYGFWVSKGATTLWEAWGEGARSYDHHMFGSVDQWFYETLAGIRPTAPGYSKIEIAPHAPGDLTSASGKVDTVLGTVASSWRKGADGAFDLDVTVPVSATATVSVPAPNRWAVVESGRPADRSPGVRFVHYEAGRAVFAVGSGTYRFRTDPSSGRVGDAIQAAVALRETAGHATLTPSQEGYLGARLDHLDATLDRSLTLVAADRPEMAGQGVQQSLGDEGDLRRWLGRQPLADADRTALGAALDGLHGALSEASADLLGVTVELSGAEEPVVAGSTVRVTAVVRNTGRRELRDVSIGASGPDGWTVRAAGDGRAASLAPGESLSLPLDVTPPVTAPAGPTVLRLAVEWTVAGGQAGISYDETLAVRGAVSTGTPSLTGWPDAPGGTATIEVPVGNAAEVTLTGSAAATVGEGWTVSVVEPSLTVPAGDTAKVRIALTASGTSVPDVAAVDLTLTLRDPAQDDVLTVRVPVRAGNLARGQAVAANHSLESAQWSKSLLVDGQRRSTDAAKGYTSDPPATSRDAVEWVSVDLGSSASVGRVVLFPRTETPNDGVRADGAGFPRDFTLQVSDDGATWRTVQVVTDHIQADATPQAYELTGATGRYLRVYVTELGDSAGDDAQLGLYRLQLAEVEVYGASISSSTR